MVVEKEEPRRFHLNVDMLKELTAEDVVDILSYPGGYNLNEDKLIVQNRWVKFVPSETYIETYYEKDWYNLHKRYRPAKLHDRVDFMAYYAGDLTKEQIKEYHAFKRTSTNGVDFYVLHGRIYVTRYGFDCRERAKRKDDKYIFFDEELGMKILENIQKRMGIFEEQIPTEKPKVVQTRLIEHEGKKTIKQEPKKQEPVKQPTKMRQESLAKYMTGEDAKQIAAKETIITQQKSEEKEEDQTSKIVKNIKKRHAVEDVDVVEMKNVKNAQNGRPECHFIAEAEMSDYDDELDEDGNYSKKRVLITGIKSGKYFESRILEKDERGL